MTVTMTENYDTDGQQSSILKKLLESLGQVN